jgi:RNA polymerase sigma-70 factor, ECF subfamily
VDGAFEETMRAAQAGQTWALGALYRGSQPRLLRYLVYREPSVAEDLASETWIKVARGLHHFRGNEVAFRAWLFTIARHSLVDWRRAQIRRPEAATDPRHLGDHRGDSDTERLALEGLSTESTLRLIAELPPDQADVVLLRVVAGLDAARVGQVMGKRPGTIRVLQHRALQRLAALLAMATEREGGQP